MNKLKISIEMRLWFIGPMLMLWTGIYLTGFDLAHWLLYVPAVMSVFAFVTGLCPGMFLIRSLLAVGSISSNKK
ncbi:MAG TPA: hypothetical protein EYG94_01310 [Campylobacterales bacterium]|nr:hypothetical protein [Campylobacterales bacterium]